MKQILITGGAGFIGAHLGHELVEAGHQVRALDALVPQVHGPGRRRPAYLDRRVELRVGDVREPRDVRDALDGVDAVVHLAALVGVGQSMYQIADYVDVNTRGTAVLLEALAEASIERLVVASSMSIYGEGLYRDRLGHVSAGAERSPAQLAAGRWEIEGPDGEPLLPIPTPESKQPSLASVYALSKYDQERLCLVFGRAYGLDTVALRFFNVYGPHQALSNPYTGVLAIFASRLLNGKPPLIFEDGLQRRDFVHVSDVARACRLALETRSAAGGVFNIGAGRSQTVLEVARHIAEATGRPELRPEITGQYRQGDIRHCTADIDAARRELGYEPRVAFERGVKELAVWLETQQAEDRVDEMRRELEERGLAI